MAFKSFYIEFFAFVVMSICNKVGSISDHPLILVVSYDGFRYNYFDKNVSPIMEKLKYSGSHADYMRNAFITKTFTNHHTIATGVHPETHGILGNSVYDPMYNETLKYSDKFWHYNNEITPIWTLNQKAGGGRHSGVMMWPGGGDQEYQNLSITFSEKYNTNVTFTDRVDTALSWFVHPTTPANLVFIYFEEPDKTAHIFGPESQKVKDKIAEMDNVTNYLVKKLEEHNLTNAVNVFLLSDHGFETVAVSRIINITDFIPPEAKYTLVESSPTYHIYPAEGDEEIIYNALKNASRDYGHFLVFRKHEILDRWYYKNSRRAPPIFVLADESYAFNDLYKYAEEYANVTNSTITENSTFGIHGYDNNEMNMHPFFIAFGPQIKKEYKLDPFDNVDLYSLFCHMLKLIPPHTNGTLENVKSLLTSESDPSLPYILGGVVVAALSITAAAIVTICLLRHRKRKAESGHSYKTIRATDSERAQRELEAQHLLEDNDTED